MSNSVAITSVLRNTILNSRLPHRVKLYDKVIHGLFKDGNRSGMSNLATAEGHTAAFPAISTCVRCDSMKEASAV